MYMPRRLFSDTYIVRMRDKSADESYLRNEVISKTIAIDLCTEQFFIEVFLQNFVVGTVLCTWTVLAV